MSEESGSMTTVFVDDKATKRRLKKSKLVVIEGPEKGKELVIDRERITAGRSVICDLQLNDKAVSGTHFEVVATEKGVMLHDLGSTNGTFVGGEKVDRTTISHQQEFTLGSTTLMFLVTPIEGSSL